MNTKIIWKPIHPIANLLVKYLQLPDHPMKVRFILAIMGKFFPEGIIVENFYGAKIMVDPEDYIGWSILSQGDYEGQTLAFATNLLNPGGIFLDIGANFGLFTCCLGMLPNVTCYAIEPFAKNFLQLQNNVNLNPKISAKLFNLALDKKVRLLEMEEYNTKNSGAARVSLETLSTTKKHTVIATTLQNILENSKIEYIDLMKIDVEGYELPILEGLNWEGGCRPRNIIIEFTDYSSRTEGEGKKTILDFFSSRDYEGMTIDGKPLSLEHSILEDNAYFKDIRYYHQS
ncbi:FkbM family methyltransferase [Nodularia spumigena]|uniref:FkbM family methyltransferase n=1 Tax=Nodularia spumigena TaxID=70799 RepID=UPI00232A93CF|nr:FkbM family methyltransferase [Nodularia spumigena]MDB9347423.1 FkbM family methyltransferase [Nodularia spumigena CS-588/01]MDB9354469.1 FkbM family methyltransferase [Nodularia spumigena CS-588/05]